MIKEFPNITVFYKLDENIEISEDSESYDIRITVMLDLIWNSLQIRRIDDNRIRLKGY